MIFSPGMENYSILDEDWKTLVSFFPSGWEQQAVHTRAVARLRGLAPRKLCCERFCCTLPEVILCEKRWLGPEWLTGPDAGCRFVEASS